MAVTAVDLIREIKSTKTNTGGRTYTRVYQVIFSDANGTAALARVASFGGVTIPEVSAAHPADAAAGVVSVDASLEGPPQGSNRIKYLVTVEYLTPDRNSPAENPINDFAQIEWGSWAYTQVVETTEGGTIERIDNSANAPFGEPYEEERHAPELRIVRNELTYDPGVADDYVDSVNVSATTICGFLVAARTAKMAEYSAVKALRNGYTYWIVTYRIQLRKIPPITNPPWGVDNNAQGWDVPLLDQGLVYKATVAGAQKWRKYELDGQEVNTPMLLNGAGVPVTTADATPYYLHFHTRKERDWTALALNITT